MTGGAVGVVGRTATPSRYRTRPDKCPDMGHPGVTYNPVAHLAIGGPGDKHLSERGVYAHGGLVYDQWDGVKPADARKIGGWWIAAAVLSEGETR